MGYNTNTICKNIIFLGNKGKIIYEITGQGWCEKGDLNAKSLA